MESIECAKRETEFEDAVTRQRVQSLKEPGMEPWPTDLVSARGGVEERVAFNRYGDVAGNAACDADEKWVKEGTFTAFLEGCTSGWTIARTCFSAIAVAEIYRQSHQAIHQALRCNGARLEQGLH